MGPAKKSPMAPQSPGSKLITTPVPAASSSSKTDAQASLPALAPTRPPYIPQFTAATRMILERMKGEPSSLGSGSSVGSALSSLSMDQTPEIKPPTYEDVKRRLVMGMSTTTSMTMEMPAPLPPPNPHSAAATATPPSAPSLRTPKGAGMSAIRRVSSGLSASRKSTSAKSVLAKTAIPGGKPKSPKTATGPKAGTKRKQGPSKMEDGGDTSGLSSPPDMSGEEEALRKKGPTPPPILTMTKSGRQVQKPLTYNPAAATEASGSRKRAQPHHQASKTRTAEQTLCKRCTRMHSPASNQMVFCDGCNDGWHQMCHDPWIDDEVIRDVGRAWFCASCQSRRDRHFAKKPRTGAAAAGGRESWAGRTPQQKRAYLSTLSQQELVGLLMDSLEAHPDLPVFPASEAPSEGSPEGQPGRAGKASVGGGRSPPGKGKAAASGGHRGQKGAPQPMEVDESQQGYDEDMDPLAPPWPKPGKGLYSLLPPEDEDEEHLVDDDDYAAISVMIFDENGRKIEENGIKL